MSADDLANTEAARVPVISKYSGVAPERLIYNNHIQSDAHVTIKGCIADYIRRPMPNPYMA